VKIAWPVEGGCYIDSLYIMIVNATT